METINFAQVVHRGCGIDIHRDTAVATISDEGITTETRSYKTFSSSLTELKEWLIESSASSETAALRNNSGVLIVLRYRDID